MQRPSGGLAVMQDRKSPVEGLDDFPTPPWATRALMEHVLHDLEWGDDMWEPAAGRGHMAEVLREYGPVIASDVHDYGEGYAVGSFTGSGTDVMPAQDVDWIITNPPFKLALQFAERAIDEAKVGAALLVRTAWLEGGERYHRLFKPCPPSVVAIFSERVPMVRGRWNPSASSATSYAWVVWRKGSHTPRMQWIPPGCRVSLTRFNDVARFGGTP